MTIIMKSSQDDLFTDTEVIEILRERVKAAGSRRALAEEFCVSSTLITMALNGYRGNFPSLFDQLGFERVTLYRKKGKK